ncbi:MAG: hypothetical protein Q4Q03_05690 [Bowdeniella nasicola]|nr:hypothetical protein [Bowdeniella nasicola]
MSEREDIQQGLQRAQLLREEADRQMFYYVQQGVAAGMSWADLAESVGVSRQNLHRKYAKKLPRNLRKKNK